MVVDEELLMELMITSEDAGAFNPCHERCCKFCWAEAGWLILMGGHLISAGKVTLRDGRRVDGLIVGGHVLGTQLTSG